PRPVEGLEEFVAWCVATQDVLAFQAALRHVDHEQWPLFRDRIAGALNDGLGGGELGSGFAGERDARGRRVARRHKLALLERHQSSLTPSGSPRPKAEEPASSGLA